MKKNKIKRHTYLEVKNIFLKEGYNLLEKEYINNETKMKFKCPNGHIHSMHLNNFLNGNRCAYCAGLVTRSLQEVQKMFTKEKYILLNTIYKSNVHPLKIKCDKGHITNTLRLGNFLLGARCRTCHEEFCKKENHPSWNDNLTNEERYSHRTAYINDEWRNKVLNKDNYHCKCCNISNKKSINKYKEILNVHHLEGYHWCKELRFDINNGITLCPECHHKFHRQFGNKYNTTEQFITFLGVNYNVKEKET